jgi:hypothetical protein
VAKGVEMIDRCCVGHWAILGEAVFGWFIWYRIGTGEARLP